MLTLEVTVGLNKYGERIFYILTGFCRKFCGGVLWHLGFVEGVLSKGFCRSGVLSRGLSGSQIPRLALVAKEKFAFFDKRNAIDRNRIGNQSNHT